MHLEDLTIVMWSSQQPEVTTDGWDVTLEWGNFTSDWDINTTEIVTTEKPVIKPPETPPITGK